MIRAALAALAIACASPASAAVHYIDGDGGGNVYVYAAAYAAMQRAGTKIVIRGPCYSSCTMALGYGACVTSSAMLGFHPAYYPILFGYILSPDGTREMSRNLPADIRRIVNARRGLADNGGFIRPRLTLIRPSELPKKYRC